MKYCKPLHGLQLAKIDRRTISARISDVAGSSGAATGNRVRATLSALFSWAMQEGLCDSNPVAGASRAGKSRARVLSDDELKIIWDALGADDYSAIIKLLILTGCRREEVGSLSWSEVTDDQIVLPPQRTKNSREHHVPVTPMVRAILDSRERDGVFVFGRHRAKAFTGWGTSKIRLDRRIRAAGHQLPALAVARFAQNFSHRFWASLAFSRTSLTVSSTMREKGIEATYDKHRYEREIATALTLWRNRVLGVVEGREHKVIPLRGA